MYFHRGLVWHEFFLIVRRDRVVIYARCVMTKPSEYTFYGTYSRRRREVRQSGRCLNSHRLELKLPRS